MTPQRMSRENSKARRPLIVRKRRKRIKEKKRRVRDQTMGVSRHKTRKPKRENITIPQFTKAPTRPPETRGRIRRTFNRMMNWMTRRDRRS